jgi:hypothetical protein
VKKLLATLALATAVGLTGVTPVHATAEPDPVKVLKAQYAEGKGVRVKTTLTLSLSGKPITIWDKGAVEFGKGGPVASDSIQSGRAHKSFREGMDKESQEFIDTLMAPTRIVAAEGKAYLSGPLFTADLPAGKNWVENSYMAGSAAGGHSMFGLVTPAALKVLLAAASPSRGGVAKGSIKSAALFALPGFSWLEGRTGRIEYSLWLDSRGLVQRLTGKTTESTKIGRITYVSDTRFTDWGTPTSIAPPPRDEIADDVEIEDYPAPTQWPVLLNQVKP